MHSKLDSRHGIKSPDSGIGYCRPVRSNGDHTGRSTNGRTEQVMGYCPTDWCKHGSKKRRRRTNTGTKGPKMSSTQGDEHPRTNLTPWPLVRKIGSFSRLDLKNFFQKVGSHCGNRQTWSFLSGARWILIFPNSCSQFLSRNTLEKYPLSFFFAILKPILQKIEWSIICLQWFTRNFAR